MSVRLKRGGGAINVKEDRIIVIHSEQFVVGMLFGLFKYPNGPLLAHRS